MKNLKQRLKAYSNLGIELKLACRNINISEIGVERIAETEGWFDELCDMFGLKHRKPRFQVSEHEGIRHLAMDEIDVLAPQLHKRLVVRVLTAPWDRRKISKEVLVNERSKSRYGLR